MKLLRHDEIDWKSRTVGRKKNAEVDDRLVSEIIKLYNRVKTYNVLPFPGGLFQQEEWIMSIFDTIDEIIAKHYKEQNKKDQILAEQKRRLENGRY